MNLIPAERLAGKRRRARLYLWAAICGVYVVLLSAGSLTARLVYPAEDRSITEQLADTARKTEQDNQTMLKLRRELAELTAALETTRAIHHQPDWSKLLVALSDELGEDIVLSRCRLMTFTEDGKGLTDEWRKSLSSKPLGVFLTERDYKLVLNGFGKSQESVSQFVLRLEEVGVFDLVRLANCCRQTFLDGEAVAFGIECHF